MATRRSGWNELRRLFDSVAVPWFVVGADRRIVWCNQALAQAAELDADELVNRTCRYHTPETNSRPDAIAAALCPPPDFNPQESTVVIVAWRNTAGEELRYQATFTSLVDPTPPPQQAGKSNPIEEVAAVLVRLRGPLQHAAGVAKTPEAILLADDPSSAELHQQVRSFRLTWSRRYQVDRLIGGSPQVQRIREQVEMASASMASVLIVGPEGSGRRHLARSIHYSQGDSRAGRLIHLSATTLAPDALPAAVHGLSAHSSSDQSSTVATLLLTDVDQLPENTQLQLETLLETPHPGLRLITTATRPLTQLVSEGGFRRNLALRLDSLSIELPSLQERVEDIPLLAQLFAEEFNAQEEKQLGGFEPGALDQLATYPWPGEVEELRSVVFEACHQASSPLIAAADLPRKIAHGKAASERPAATEEAIQLDEFLAEIESEIVRRALHQAKGNKSKAAALLGLTRPRLYRRLVQLGLED